MAPLIVHDVHAYYGKAHVLHGLSLVAKRGCVTGILGRNGAGKTTLLKSVMRLGPVVSGKVQVLEHDTSALKADAIARLGVAYMPQDVRVFPHLSVRENILVAAHAARQPKTLEEILVVLPDLHAILEQMAGTLSGGQQQLVGIGRSLAMRCQLLLMDEPTEGLMPRLVDRVAEIVRQLADEGVAVVLVEQNIHVVMRVSDRIYIMEKGEIKAEGSGEEIASGDLLDRFLGVNVLKTS